MVDIQQKYGLDSFRAFIMEFKDRLQIFMADKNLSANGLATKMGYESGSRISRVLRGEGHPSFDFISKLCDLYPDLRMDWLKVGFEQRNGLFHIKMNIEGHEVYLPKGFEDLGTAKKYAIEHVLTSYI